MHTDYSNLQTGPDDRIDKKKTFNDGHQIYEDKKGLPSAASLFLHFSYEFFLCVLLEVKSPA
jgi:hypothetical protein